MATIPAIPSGQRLVLPLVDWQMYSRLLRAFEERPGVRLTYDRGLLEIRTLTFGHESHAHLLGRFIVALTEELGLSLAGGKSTTLRRRRARRGLEPDECYWIEQEALMRGKDRIDLRVDPPPDLSVEVDITRSSIDRLSIYARLGVREVWRYADGQVTFLVLGAGSQYAVSATSRAFPFVTSADVTRFQAMRGQADENAIVRDFRAWVRQAAGLAP